MAITTTTQGIQNGACLSTARPTNPYLGMVIFETDTNKMKVWLGSVWSDGFTHVYTPPTFDYDSLATVTVGAGGQSTITFSSIPQTYKHLQIRILHGSNTSSADSVDIRYNSDTGSNYTYHALYGTGSVTGSEASNPRTAAVVPVTAIANTNTNMFSHGIIDILDYANTNKYKTQKVSGGWDVNGNGQAFLGSASWMSASAISQIQIYTRAGVGFKQYSHFALYGIKG